MSNEGELHSMILIGINFYDMKNIDINKFFFLGALVLAGVLAVSCSSSLDKDTFSIKGKIDGLSAPYFMCAVELYADSLIVDTVRVNAKGEFNYRSKIDAMSKVSLYFSNTQLSPLFVDKGTNIEIEGNVSDIYSLKIDGGAVNDAVVGFKKRNRELIETDSPLLLDSAKVYVDKNKDNFISVAFLDLFLKNKLSSFKLDSLFRSLSDIVQDMPYSKNVLFDINDARRAEVGMSAPGFNVKNTKGKEIKLDDYSGDKTILLTFVEKEDSVHLKLYSEIEKAHPSIIILPFMIGIDKSEFKNLKRSYLFDGKGWGSDMISNYLIKSSPYYVLITSPKQIKSRGVLGKETLKTIETLDEDRDKLVP